VPRINISILAITFLALSCINTFAGEPIRIPLIETDNNKNFSIMAFFDLRDRESFVQVTNTSTPAANLHVQIFNVGNLCNENDFFDDYTGNDTHIYNLREIITNDGAPSGVVLPDDAYGIVVVSSEDNGADEIMILGNFRVLDNNGYEYRTNMPGTESTDPDTFTPADYFANFNQEGGVTLSDVVGLLLVENSGASGFEWDASNVIDTFIVADVDIVDNNEVLLSCRDVIFACVRPDDPLVDELLANNDLDGVNGASVASFEYGINNAIPNSKGGELLCPGNVIGEGILNLTVQGIRADGPFFAAFIGLNNGNGRGSMDSLWQTSLLLSED